MDMARLAEFVGNHWIMSSGLFIVSLLLIQDLYDTLTRKHKSTSPAAAVALLNDEDAVVIDVRDPQEYAKGHIENAIHVPFARLDEKIFELSIHKDKPVIVACQQGTRSAAACKKLVKAGFAQVHDLKGGILAWEDAKLPLITRKGK
jgi:rhodanese-related sulfurtransferase